MSWKMSRHRHLFLHRKPRSSAANDGFLRKDFGEELLALEVSCFSINNAVILNSLSPLVNLESGLPSIKDFGHKVLMVIYDE